MKRFSRKLLSAAIVAAATTLMYSWANTLHIKRTHYTLSSEKLNADLRIVFISDIHYGGVQDKNVLPRYIDAIDAEDADIIILGGDIVYFATDKQEMEKVFSMLGSLHSKFGTYFIYGNHDRQEDVAIKHYSEEELVDAIVSNGITILTEECRYIRDNIMLIGRDDISHFEDEMRPNLPDIFSHGLYTIVADHQPVNVNFNARMGVDLQLSGHAHAGQIFPVDWLFLRLQNKPVYGYSEHGRMKLIISSGAGVGKVPLRNLQHCEYVVVDVRKE